MAEPAESVLITGGAGFMGSALVRQWLEHEAAAVVNLDALTYAGLRGSVAEVAGHPRYRLCVGDVADGTLVRELLAEHQPRLIVHLAAETHVDRSIAEPPSFVRTNVLGTCTLLDQATAYWRGLQGARRASFRFVLISTDEVFGSAAPGERFDRESSLAPNSPYAASKAAGEHLAHAFGHTYGLPIITVNPTNNYGPRQFPEKLIPKMILAAARGEALPVYGDGRHERDWLHVEDCCGAIRAAALKGEPGRRYLVGGDHCVANLQVAEQICDLVDARAPAGAPRRRLIQHVADRLGHDRRYAVDASAARRELGWSPRVDFLAGLSAAVDWYLDNPAWVAEAEGSLQRRDAAEGTP